MRSIRAILVGLIALAVAMAPVAVALYAGAGPRPANAAPMHDCHGNTPEQHGNAHDKAAHDQVDESGCLDCDGHSQRGCIGASGKCCKLTGVVAILPVVKAPTETVVLAVSPPAPTGWQERPWPPPPRA